MTNINNIPPILLRLIISFVKDNIDRICFSLTCKRLFKERGRYFTFNTDNISLESNRHKYNNNHLTSYKNQLFTSLLSKNDCRLEIVNTEQNKSYDYKIIQINLNSYNSLPINCNSVTLNCELEQSSIEHLSRILQKSRVTRIENYIPLSKNQPLSNNIKSIVCDNMFRTMEPGCFPAGLTYLEVAFLDHPIQCKLLPSTLKSLKIDRFNHTLTPGCLPEGLLKLEFGQYNQPLIPGTFPEGLQELTFGFIPSSVKFLEITSTSYPASFPKGSKLDLDQLVVTGRSHLNSSLANIKVRRLIVEGYTFQKKMTVFSARYPLGIDMVQLKFYDQTSVQPPSQQLLERIDQFLEQLINLIYISMQIYLPLYIQRKIIRYLLDSSDEIVDDIESYEFIYFRAWMLHVALVCKEWFAMISSNVNGLNVINVKGVKASQIIRSWVIGKLSSKHSIIQKLHSLVVAEKRNTIYSTKKMLDCDDQGLWDCSPLRHISLRADQDNAYNEIESAMYTLLLPFYRSIRSATLYGATSCRDDIGKKFAMAVRDLKNIKKIKILVKTNLQQSQVVPGEQWSNTWRLLSECSHLTHVTIDTKCGCMLEFVDNFFSQPELEYLDISDSYRFVWFEMDGHESVPSELFNRIAGNKTIKTFTCNDQMIHKITSLPHILLSKIIETLPNIDKITFSLVCKRCFQERDRYLTLRDDIIRGVTSIDLESVFHLNNYKSTFLNKLKSDKTNILLIQKNEEIDNINIRNNIDCIYFLCTSVNLDSRFIEKLACSNVTPDSILPPNLEVLECTTLKSPISNDIVIPSTLHRVSINFHNIEYFKRCTTITWMKLYQYESPRSIQPGDLPLSVVDLTVVFNSSKRNQIRKGVFPLGLKYLALCGGPISIEPGVLSELINLEELSINSILQENTDVFCTEMFPSKLRKLNLPFNLSRIPSQFPKDLAILSIGNSFSFDFPAGAIPDSVRSLDFQEYKRRVEQGAIPPTVQSVSMHIDFLQYNPPTTLPKTLVDFTIFEGTNGRHRLRRLDNECFLLLSNTRHLFGGIIHQSKFNEFISKVQSLSEQQDVWIS
ncbi:hypothetical protein PPL_01488 [Heterostelium album PN500]|uniref:F-box domain-containing protein n=1 Tax=Heterostelium pallidum (strain ATCC 26659 / Pp 5 / PN500) TaxID=670386 RepID=D3AZE7_HETP5|nr:hypothetical protein PPL_01488 [Heterostelium album PN500]EFA85530.1 hypothetical protein PPL_01488 [Heterostelium album PN500]|eukprot:XP_020437638.1 hypothetical protein PPL_01488 [Heterostelium album PN500]